MKVCHYLGFDADQRLSMQIYADTLARILEQDLELQRFTPHSRLERFATNRFAMRYLRYMKYPAMVNSWAADNLFDIHHVLDHGYAHLLPKLSANNQGKSKTCITVHDLIPLLTWKGVIPQGQNKRSVRKPALNLYSLNFIQGFDHIIVPSQSTANDLQKYLDIAPDKISHIAPIIADHFTPASSEAVCAFKKQSGLDSEAKWILISGREYYKNHAACLAVLEELKRRSSVPIKILKIGLNSPEFDQQVASRALADSVKTLFLDDFSLLPLVYSSVDCLLFPSFYEGFGMPVAEALACGTPVVCSNAGSLPEVAGELALQCAPDDLFGLGQSVEQALFDPAVKTLVSQQGQNWVSQWRGKIVKQSITALYKELLG